MPNLVLKKWTGSTTLGFRFSENVLSDPKSFTRRDFTPLQTRYDEISCTLYASAPVVSEPSSPQSIEQTLSDPARLCLHQRQPEFEPLPPPPVAKQVRYWNEYDNGSECGSPDDEYAIYVNPDEDTSFPILDYIQGILKVPIEKARKWLKLDKAAERQSLLTTNDSSVSYSSTTINSESDVEGCASSQGYPSSEYATHYTLPRLSQQEVNCYHENVLFWGTIGYFIASFILLAVAGILIFTGKHKLRVEVDVGVIVCVVASLLSACTGLGMTLYRRDPLSLLYRLMVWSTFAASCLLNGMLLVLLVGNTP